MREKPTTATFVVQEAPAEVEPKFSPFKGVGKRLDGKPLKHQPPPVSSPGAKGKRPEASNGGSPHSAGSTSQSTASHQTQGKLVFGSNVNHAPKGTQKVAAKETKQEEPQKKEESKFQAFTGKKYSLKG